MRSQKHLSSAPVGVSTGPPSAPVEILAPPEDVSTVRAMTTGVSQNDAGRWVATYREKRADGSYKRHQKTFATEQEARAWRTDRMGVKPGTGVPQGTNIVQTSADTYRVEVKSGSTRRKATFSTLEEATAWRAACSRALDAGLPLPDPSSVVAKYEPVGQAPALVGELLTTWHAKRYVERAEQGEIDPMTVKAVAYAVRRVMPQLGAVPVGELTPERCETFVQGMADAGYAKSTQRQALWVLWSAYDLARNRGWVSNNPAYGVYARKPAAGVRAGGTSQAMPNRDVDGQMSVHYVTLPVARAISAQMREEDALALWLGRLTGLRVGEIFGLTLKDIDVANGLIHVRGQGGREFTALEADGTTTTAMSVRRTKGKVTSDNRASTRALAIPKALAPHLEQRIAARILEGATDDDRLIPWRYAGYCARLRKFSADLIDGERTHARSHDMRKSCATDLAAWGVPARLVSLWLGHKVGATDGQSAITARAYTHLRNVDNNAYVKMLRQVADIIDEYLTAELDGPLIPDTLEGGEWIRVSEAAAAIGASTEHVYDLIKAGHLDACLRRSAVRGRPHVWHVSVGSLQKWQETTQFSLAAVATRLDMDPRGVMRIADDLGIVPQRAQSSLVGLGKVVFSEEDVARLEEGRDLRETFLREHMSGLEALKELRIGGIRFRALVGVAIQPVPVEQVPRHLGGNSHPARWFRRSDVKALVKKLKKR